MAAIFGTAGTQIDRYINRDIGINILQRYTDRQIT